MTATAGPDTPDDPPEDGLAAVEAVLSQAIDGIPGPLREPCRRIAGAGGERLRAALLLVVAGQAWPGTSRRTAVAAAAVELLHLATLVHDDAPLRDGTPTLGAKEGPAVALLAGNTLTGLAFRLATTADAGHPIADAVVALQDCSASAELRAGMLFATAARLGAIVTGTPEDGLHDYGLAFGAVVQLLDDGAARRATIDELVERAAAARPELADVARRYRDSRLAPALPRYRAMLSW